MASKVVQALEVTGNVFLASRKGANSQKTFVFIGEQGQKEIPADFSTPARGNPANLADATIVGDTFLSVGRNFMGGKSTYPSYVYFAIPSLPVTPAGQTDDRALTYLLTNSNAQGGGNLFVEGMNTVSLPRGRNFYCQKASIGSMRLPTSGLIPAPVPPTVATVFFLGNTTPANITGILEDEDQAYADYIVGLRTDASTELAPFNVTAIPEGYNTSLGTPPSFPTVEGIPETEQPSGFAPVPVTSRYTAINYRLGPPLEFTLDHVLGGAIFPINWVILPSPAAMQNSLEKLLGRLPPQTIIAVDIGFANGLCFDLDNAFNEAGSIVELFQTPNPTPVPLQVPVPLSPSPWTPNVTSYLGPGTVGTGGQQNSQDMLIFGSSMSGVVPDTGTSPKPRTCFRLMVMTSFPQTSFGPFMPAGMTVMRIIT